MTSAWFHFINGQQIKVPWRRRNGLIIKLKVLCWNPIMCVLNWVSSIKTGVTWNQMLLWPSGLLSHFSSTVSRREVKGYSCLCFCVREPHLWRGVKHLAECERSVCVSPTVNLRETLISTCVHMLKHAHAHTHIKKKTCTGLLHRGSFFPSSLAKCQRGLAQVRRPRGRAGLQRELWEQPRSWSLWL